MRGLDPLEVATEIPMLIVSQCAPWLEIPVAAFVNSMRTVYEGGSQWDHPTDAYCCLVWSRCNKIQLAIILPANLALDDWYATLVSRTSCWPIRLSQEWTYVPPARLPSYPSRCEDQLGTHQAYSLDWTDCFAT